jgi:hypothetical protein
MGSFSPATILKGSGQHGSSLIVAVPSPRNNHWLLLALAVLLVGLGVQLVHSLGGTQRDPRRELRKF